MHFAVQDLRRLELRRWVSEFSSYMLLQVWAGQDVGGERKALGRREECRFGK